jgi:DNA mismatch endonuclease (patch repair protein)
MDTLSRKERSQRMSLIRNRDTKPELLVRRLVHGSGYRYRLHGTDLPGKPDLVFPGRKKVIFVHGCFWHRHPKCSLARLPKSRLSFWLPKLTENRDSRLIEDRLYLESVALAPYRAELNQFAVFVVGRIGIGKIVPGRIAEFRRFVLEESWRRLKLRRSRWLLLLYFCLQPALPDLVRKSLLGKRRQFGALRDEDQQFLVTHAPIALGDAQKFPRRIESVHSRRNNIPATAARHLSRLSKAGIPRPRPSGDFCDLRPFSSQTASERHHRRRTRPMRQYEERMDLVTPYCGIDVSPYY